MYQYELNHIRIVADECVTKDFEDKLAVAQV